MPRDNHSIKTSGVRHLILVGMMGSGKSSVARRLGSIASCLFVDLDEMIEDSAQCSIPEIFERHGEPYFRELEDHALSRAISTGSPIVIALGGGALMRKENRDLVREHLVVWLTARPETILGRLQGNRDRPLLRGDSLKEVIALRFGEREFSYKEVAGLVVSTDLRSEDDIAREILELSKWPVLESQG